MQQICEYCGGYINDTDSYCSNCGGPNRNVVRMAEGIPRTIEELKNYALAHNLPLEQMRFFIGVDYNQPKAFGIYEQNGEFIVYKNKADGSRAIRYRGRDEAYAVNELYQKMHSEIMQRKGQSGVRQTGSAPSPRSISMPTKKNRSIVLSLFRPMLFWLIPFILFIIIAVISGSTVPDKGYYNYNGSYVYYQGSSWYEYDKSDGWQRWEPDDDFLNHRNDYYNGNSYNSDYDIEDFKNSEYYDPGSGSGSDNDWNSDWDDDDYWDGNDSWDSNDTNWDSDW